MRTPFLILSLSAAMLAQEPNEYKRKSYVAPFSEMSDTDKEMVRKGNIEAIVALKEAEAEYLKALWKAGASMREIYDETLIFDGVIRPDVSTSSIPNTNRRNFAFIPGMMKELVLIHGRAGTEHKRYSEDILYYKTNEEGYLRAKLRIEIAENRMKYSWRIFQKVREILFRTKPNGNEFGIPESVLRSKW